MKTYTRATFDSDIGAVIQQRMDNSFRALMRATGNQNLCQERSNAHQMMEVVINWAGESKRVG